RRAHAGRMGHERVMRRARRAAKGLSMLRTVTRAGVAASRRTSSDPRNASPEGSRAWTERSRAWTEGSRAWTEGSSARTEGSGAWTEGSRARTEGSGAWTERSGARTEGSGARTDGSGAWTDGSGARTDGSGAWTEGSGAWKVRFIALTKWFVKWLGWWDDFTLSQAFRDVQRMPPGLESSLTRRPYGCSASK